MRRKPYSVVLFDEIEKAHPEVFNVMLQLLDDGRLTDGQGRTVDFRNTVIIMTSNAGSELWLSQKNNVTRDELNRVLQSTFKPEFLNRLDEIVVFHGLTKDDLNRIVDIQLKRVKELLAQRDIKIELTQAAKDYIVDKGADTDFGARPLKRAIQHELQDPLALEILEGSFVEGDTVKVDSNGEKLSFSK